LVGPLPRTFWNVKSTSAERLETKFGKHPFKRDLDLSYQDSILQKSGMFNMPEHLTLEAKGNLSAKYLCTDSSIALGKLYTLVVAQIDHLP